MCPCISAQMGNTSFARPANTDMKEPHCQCNDMHPQTQTYMNLIENGIYIFCKFLPFGPLSRQMSEPYWVPEDNCDYEALVSFLQNMATSGDEATITAVCSTEGVASKFPFWGTFS
jgi:hypothetical protein